MLDGGEICGTALNSSASCDSADSSAKSNIGKRGRRGRNKGNSPGCRRSAAPAVGIVLDSSPLVEYSVHGILDRNLGLD